MTYSAHLIKNISGIRIICLSFITDFVKRKKLYFFSFQNSILSLWYNYLLFTTIKYANGENLHQDINTYMEVTARQALETL